MLQKGEYGIYKIGKNVIKRGTSQARYYFTGIIPGMIKGPMKRTLVPAIEYRFPPSTLVELVLVPR